jgi:hypothetical protein
VAGSFGMKEHGLLRSLEHFRGFLGRLEWLGPNHNYFSKIEGPVAIIPTSRDHGLIYNNLRSLFVKFMRFNRIRFISQR